MRLELLFCFLFIALPVSCKNRSSNLNEETASDEISLSEIEEKLKELVAWAVQNKEMRIPMADEDAIKKMGAETEAWTASLTNMLIIASVRKDFFSQLSLNSILPHEHAKGGQRAYILQNLIADQAIPRNGDGIRLLSPLLMLTVYLESSKRLWAGLVSEAELSEALTSDIDIAKVKWNGEEETHEFLAEQDAHVVGQIALAILFQNDLFKKVFTSLPLERQNYWRSDRNDVAGSSRTEPYDMILSALKKFSIEDSDYNYLTFGYFLEPHLKKLLGVTSVTAKEKVFVLRDSNLFEMNAQIFCVSEKPLTLFSRLGSATNTYKIDSQDWIKWFTVQTYDYYNFAIKETQLQCDDDTYRLAYERIGKGIQVEKPATVNFPDPIKAVASIALVDEMNKQLLATAVAYMIFHGYMPKSLTTVSDLKKDFTAESKQAHIIIPIGHAFNANHTNLGVDGGIKLEFYQFTNSLVGKRRIDLVVYLPPLVQNAGANSVQLQPKDISNILCERNCKPDEALVVFNNSCNSEQTINAWMTQYFKLRMDKKTENITFPTVMAADRGFETSSFLQIVSHSNYMIAMLDEFSKGSSVDDVKKRLSNPDQFSFKRKMLNFAAIAMNVRKLDEKDETSGFDPVCNLDKENFFDGTGMYRFVLKHEANKTKLEF